jgi:hypothetical protein
MIRDTDKRHAGGVPATTDEIAAPVAGTFSRRGTGLPVKLDVWPITSEYSIVEQYDDKVTVNFKFWDENQKTVRNKMGCLTFTGVWTLRYSRFNKTRYYPDEMEHDFKSYYLEIQDSDWLKSMKNDRAVFDNGWEKYDHRDYKHYVVQNSSYFIEIIAQAVEFQIRKITRQYRKTWN